MLCLLRRSGNFAARNRRREPLRPPLILRDRFTRQNDRLVTRRRCEVIARRRALARLPSIARLPRFRRWAALCPIAAFASLVTIATTAPTATASTPAALARSIAILALTRGRQRRWFSHSFLAFTERLRLNHVRSRARCVLHRIRRFCAHLRLSLLGGHRSVRWNHVGQIFIVLLEVHEIGNVEERVALQPDIDEGRLHAGQHARHPPFVNGSRERVFVLALEVDFSK